MKLSVFVVTYNQERYIHQCLDSVLMQEVSFPYEVIVGDDCSTDGTGAILDEYAAKYPQIQVYHHEKNKGLLGNWEFVMNKCQGDYIALLEGDDYWIDPHKLQRQVDWLEAHPDFTLTFTRAEIQYENGASVGAERLLPTLPEGEVTVQDICRDFIVLSSSCVIRNCLQPVHYCNQLLYADTYTFIELLKRGKAYCLAVPTVKYRIHKGNLSYDGDWKFYEQSYRQDLLFAKQYPYLADMYLPRAENCLVHLLYNRDKSLKYRWIYIRKHPQKLFSRFMLTTIWKYILKR